MENVATDLLQFFNVQTLISKLDEPRASPSRRRPDRRLEQRRFRYAPFTIRASLRRGLVYR